MPPRDASHKGLYPASLPSLYKILGWESEALISLDHGCGDLSHQGGYQEGHSWKVMGVYWGPSPTGAGRVNGVSRGKVIFGI